MYFCPPLKYSPTTKDYILIFQWLQFPVIINILLSKRMKSYKSLIKAGMLAFTIVLLLAFAFYQYLGYKTDTRVTKNQLQLNTLREEIIRLDEGLTLSARLYVVTEDSQWKQYYQHLASQYNKVISDIFSLLPENFLGKAELQSGGMELFNLEAKAFDAISHKKMKEGKSILYSDKYNQQKRIYKTGIDNLKTYLNASTDAFMVFHQRKLIENEIVIAVFFLLIFLCGFSIMQVSKKWQKELTNLEQRRVEDALTNNLKLQHLSVHLQEVREKERSAIAYDINEELGQQLAVIKVKLKLVYSELGKTQHTQINSLPEILELLSSAIMFLKKLATDVYPSILRDLGIIEAMDWECKRLSENFGISILFSSDLETITLNQQATINLFRIYQEKITTIALSNATDIFCCLKEEKGAYELSIFDDAIVQSNQEKNVEINNIAIVERVRAIKGIVKMEQSKHRENSFVLLIPSNNS